MSTKKHERQHVRQRRYERVVVQFVSSTHDRLPPGTVVRCSTDDVSPRGVAIQMDRQLPEGFLLEIWIEFSGHPREFYLLGEVKWCRELAEGERNLVGVELKERQNDDFKPWQEALDVRPDCACARRLMAKPIGRCRKQLIT
jgi:hypothetical protein